MSTVASYTIKQQYLRIPYQDLTRQYASISHELLQTLDDVLQSGQYMNSIYTEELEHWLEQYMHGTYRAELVHSGTQALEMIAKFYKHRGAEIALVPALTFPATANAFANEGYEVKFCDVDERGIIDLNKADTDEYDIVVPVGLYGTALNGFQSDKIIVEDAAQNWLGNYGKRLGSASALSFDPTKNLGSHGNGGAVVTHNRELRSFVERYKNHGKDGREFMTPGTNSRMSEMDAANVYVKTHFIDGWQKRRRKIAEYWMDRLPDLHMIDDIETHALQKFVVRVQHQTHSQNRLHAYGINTGIHYPDPIPRMNGFFDYDQRTPQATYLSQHILSLPFYPELTDMEVEFIADKVNQNVDAANPTHS